MPLLHQNLRGPRRLIGICTYRSQHLTSWGRLAARQRSRTLVADRFVSAGLSSLYKRIRRSRRGFRLCPLPGPVAVPQHLVAGMDSEFDEHRSLRNTEHLGAEVDDTPALFRWLLLDPVTALCNGNDPEWRRDICRTEERCIGLVIGHILIDAPERVFG
jgi:hypothetical protein